MQYGKNTISCALFGAHLQFTGRGAIPLFDEDDVPAILYNLTQEKTMKKIILTSITLLSLAATLAQANNIPQIPMNTNVTTRETKRTDAVAKLPKDKAELYKKTEEDLKIKFRDIRTKIQALRKESRAIFESEQFNKDVYLKKAEEIQKLESEKYNIRTRAIADLAPKFTPSERKVLIGAFEDRNGKKFHSPLKNSPPEKQAQ